MTNREVVAKKLAFIETCVADLRSKATPATFTTDIVQLRFAQHTLQLAIQAALDVASHIVSDERLGEPKTNADLFRALVTAGWLGSELGPVLVKIAGFRNLLVHAYVEVDPEEVAKIVRERLPDLETFAAAIRTRI